MSFFRALPPTPAEYRNEKALADLMLGENAMGYVGGAGSCSGCGEATALRMLVAATRQVHGPESMGMVAATGCNTVYGSTYPFNPCADPVDQLALRERARRRNGHPRRAGTRPATRDRRLWVVGGDGAMYDIGFQSLSRMVASGADIKVMVLDTQAYSNTGGQSSTATLRWPDHQAVGVRQGASTATRSGARSWAGSCSPTARSTWPRPRPRTSTTSTARSWMPTSIPARRCVVVYTPCSPSTASPTTRPASSARLAVDSRAFPLFTYDPRRGDTLAERLSLQGNPALREDWCRQPDGSVTDFLSFARTEGRFAPHFAADGSPSVEIQATAAERLRNWRDAPGDGRATRPAVRRPPG